MNKEMNNDNIFIVSKKIKKNKKQKILIIEDDECEINENTKENLQILNKDYWENLYNEKYNKNKYKKNNKNFSKKITGKSCENPHIYIIPRERGGPSYKKVQLEYDNAEDIHFCPVSKGFSMQDVSSFTLGPVVGHGLNVVNSAFSKCIAIKHIDGSGAYCETNKKFWKKSRKAPIRKIINISNEEMIINEVVVNKINWLENNKDLWYEDWKKWHDMIRLNPNGNFNWCDDSETIIFCNCIDNPYINLYMNFVDWKKLSYIEPAYKLFNENNRVIQFLKFLYQEKKISIGLVHPKGRDNHKEKALTKEFIEDLYNSTYEMSCMPYVVAGYLLGSQI
jgi:hypothetical protein